MWVVLDTNHFTELVRESAAGLLLQEHFIASNADVFLPVVAAQECLQGWLAVVNRHKAGPDQVREVEAWHYMQKPSISLKRSEEQSSRLPLRRPARVRSIPSRVILA